MAFRHNVLKLQVILGIIETLIIDESLCMERLRPIVRGGTVESRYEKDATILEDTSGDF